MEIFGVYLVNQSSGATIPLFMDRPNLIGRGVPTPQGEKGKVLLPHPSISKFHAKIQVAVETHTWVLTDMSRHGILVNGEKVNKEIRLHHGDKIELGPFTLMFYEKFKADDETSEQPLPFVAHPTSRIPAWLSLTIVFIVLAISSLISPTLLFMLSFSIFFFVVILSVLPAWRQKTAMSGKFLLLLFLLAIIGGCLGFYMRLKGISWAFF